MKNKLKEVLKKCIDYIKPNWKKIAIITGSICVVIVVSVVANNIRVNSVKNDIKEQLSGKTFEKFEELGSGGWTLDSYTFQEDGKYIKDVYYYYRSNSDTIDHTSHEYVTNIEVSLFGKVTVGGNEVIFNDGEIVALKSSITDDTYEMVEISHLKQIAVDVFCELKVWENLNYSENYGEMIDIIYKDYNVTCTAVEGSNTKYVLAFDGTYYPNKRELPNHTEPGILSVEVDISTKTCKILKDQGVTTAMRVYVVLGYS